MRVRALLALAIVVLLAAEAASAALLPRNSVGSPQVKPNSLKGIDINEGTLGPVPLSLNSSQLQGKPASDFQARVHGVCPAGQAIFAVNLDGSVQCLAVAGGPVAWDDLTDVPAGFADRVDDIGGAPSGPATGDLTGTYPNPSIANGAVTPLKLSFDPFTQTEFSALTALLASALTEGGDRDELLVHWSRLASVPEAFADAAIDWSEVAGIPSGFADGSDDISGMGTYCALAQTHPRSYPDTPCANITLAEVVDPAHGGLDGSMTIGADGNPVMSYYEPVNGDVKVAKCNDPSCSAPRLNVIATGGNTGLFTSIAIGADGYPVISFYRALNNDLYFAKCNDLACAGAITLRLIESGGDVGRYSSIAISTDGNPVISYARLDPVSSRFVLKVAKCNDAACTTKVTNFVDLDGNVGRYSTSATIGADGNPVIGYHDDASGDLKVAKCNDAACAGGDETITIVDSTDDVGLFASIAIGTDGNPVITYLDETNLRLKVAKCNDAACAGANETISAVGTVGSIPDLFSPYTSIAIDAEGNPMISYYDGSTGDLKLARCNDAACAGGDETIRAIDTVGDVGKYSSIALGIDSRPVISYFDDTNNDLRVARAPES